MALRKTSRPTKRRKSSAQRILAPNPSVGLYRKIAISFLVVVALLLIVVVYLSTVQALIRVKADAEPIKAEFLLDVVQTPTRPSEIRGTVVAASLERTQTFLPSGDGVSEVEDIATGEVTIFNTSSKNQPLVATTRLLSESGVLFRLVNGVTVPAGGQVTGQVYADQPGASGNHAPTKFTIPGLTTVRQQSVFAESDTAFTGGVKQISVISEAEREASKETLTTTLEQDLQTQLRSDSGALFDGEAFFTDITSASATVAPGEEAESYEWTIGLEQIAVFYDKEALENIALQQLFQQLQPGTQLVDPDVDDIEVSVERYNVAEKKANIRVVFAGRQIASATSDALDPSRFKGMNAQEVRELLVGEGIANDVFVEFFPFWVSTVPRLRDHILIEIE